MPISLSDKDDKSRRNRAVSGGGELCHVPVNEPALHGSSRSIVAGAPMNTPKTVLITGCSTGIGRALCLELASRGARVFATARRVETIAALKSERLTPLALDVLDAQSRARAVAEVAVQGNGIDVLVNNAGVSITAPLVETPIERIETLINTNLTATIAMIQAVFPHMAERGGRIVNVGSAIGVLPTPFTAAYCATKAGLHMLSDVLRLELAPFGIDVVTVQPAAVRSEIEDRAAEGLEAFTRETSRYKRFYKGLQHRVSQPKKNPVSAEDYARLMARAVLAPHPPRVVHGGTGSVLFRTAARLPPGIRDFFLRREFGLDAL